MRFPSNLQKLYGKTDVNLIKFAPISFKSAKMSISDSRTTFTAKPDMKNAVYMELPENMDISDSHSWEAGDTLGFGAMGATMDAMERIGKGATERATGKIAGLVSGSYLNEDVVKNQYQMNTGETVINPNTTLIFNSTGLRSLRIDFVLRPENEPEAREATEIVNFFKYYSRGSVTGKDYGGIQFPYLWYIQTTSDELNALIESGDAESESLLFACDTVNPKIHTDVMYHEKYPHQIDLSLAFTEMRPRYR